MFSARGLISDAHEAAITAVAYSPHRREFYTAGADNLVKCWETESGAFVRSLAGHKGWVTDLLYIPSLRQLVSSSIDGKLLCWGLKAGSTQSKNEKIDFHSLCEDQPGGDLGTPIHCMAYCERRRMLVTATDGTINMYTVKVENRKMKLEFLSKVRQHADLIRILLIIEDRLVLSAGYDRKIGVFDLDTEVRSYIAKPADGGHDGAIAAMTFDTLNNRVITGGYDRRVKVWSTDGRLLQNFEDFATSVTGLCYCEVTRHLWACCSCGRPYVYDLHSGSNITEIVHTGVDGLRSPSMLKLWYFEGTKDVIATTANREVIYWRYNPTAALRVLHGHSNWVEVLAVSNPPAPEIPELFSAGMDKKVKKWELGTKFNPDAIYCNDEYVGHSATILCALFSDEHSLLFTGSEDMSIRVWQYATEKKRLDLDSVELYELTEHEERVTGLACAEHILISVSWDQTVRFWDMLTGTYHEAWTIEDAHDDYIYDVEYVGRASDLEKVDQFATCSADRTIKVWDFSTRKVLHTLSGHAGEVYKLTWNRMHSLWVSGGEDSTIRTWSLEGDPMATIHSRDAVTALCTDNETGYCIAASLDLAIRVYDLVAQEVVTTHTGHTDSVRQIVHLPQKNEYISASWDQTIRIWRAQGASSPMAEAGADAVAETAASEAAAAAAAAAATAAAANEEEEEEEELTYAELHPLVVPKTIKDMEAKGSSSLRTGDGGGSGGGGRKGPRSRKPAAGGSAPEPARRATTRVELRLSQLEADLKQADHLLLQGDDGA